MATIERGKGINYDIFVAEEYGGKDCPEKHRWPCREAINWGLDDIEKYWYALESFEKVAIKARIERILWDASYLPVLIKRDRYS